MYKIKFITHDGRIKYTEPFDTELAASLAQSFIMMTGLSSEIIKICKGCQKEITIGSWCKDCYEEFHESPVELERENASDAD
jgi:hypothetical protein